MRNNTKLKLLIIVLILFLCPFFVRLKDTFGIYRTTLSTTVNLSVLDPNASYVVRLEYNDGTGNYRNEYRAYNQELGNVAAPPRTNYNFLGWYDGTGSNANRVYLDQVITGDVTYYAKWQQIVCKKVTDPNNLHTETCESGGCRVSAINLPLNSTITYGTTYGPSSPVAGDAYDCDVNNDGTYDAQTQYGKYTERFYFLRFVDNGSDETTGALVYYTSIDSNGPVDSQHNTNIGSTNYTDASAWLPTATTGTNPWDNPVLIDFDSGNGKVTRFLTFDDLSAVCGTITGARDATYFANCGKWFLVENTKFQSANHGRAGIWLQPYNNHYYRIQAESMNVHAPDTGANSANTARPVIEIPLSAFEGFKNTDKHTITFDTHGGVPQIENKRVYTGDEIGTIATVTKDHYTFDGWYAEYSNGVYSTPVTSATIVEADMTLHAKWNPLPTNTVTFNANGGTINGESTYDLIVDTGSTIDENDFPEAVYLDHSFDGWYTDPELTEPFDETESITEDITLYAAWVMGNHVARVNGVGYDTLAAAINAVPTGTQEKTRVTILKDITLSETVTIPNNKWVEIDGGNHTIDGNVILFTNNGKLDIISGTMNTANPSKSVSIVKNNSSSSILNISGGVLTNNNTTQGDNSVVENTSGTVNVTGGVLTSHAVAAAINVKGGTLNLSGGRIIGTNTSKGQAVYVSGSGVANISGDPYLESVSAHEGDANARATVDNDGGTLVITGGTIVSKAYNAVESRGTGPNTRIGTNDDVVNISTPVMRGYNYGFKITSGTVSVYDGMFESYVKSQAISTTNVTKPTGIDFKTDGTRIIDGDTYNIAYLLAPSITINFYEDSNGTAIPVVVDNGMAIGNDLPTPTPRQGYYFAGWFINEDPLQPVTSATVVLGTFDAYAKWVQSVSNATMDTTMSIQINSSEKIEFEEDDIESVTYASSDTNVATVDADGTVHAVNVGTATITLTGDMSGDTRTVTVTVTRIMRTVKFYDSDYDPNDIEHSTLLNTVQVISGSSIGANMPNTTKVNYVLNAWYINGNSVTPFTSGTTVNEDIIVVANWKERVTYATLSTTPSPFELIVGENGQITLSARNQGEEVEEYTLTSDDTDVVTIGSNNVIVAEEIGTTDVIITGSLSHETRSVSVTVDVLKYTVTFKDGNSVIKTVRVEAGSTVGTEMPPNQTKVNYIFNGWLFEKNNNLTPFTSATEVLGDVEVYASWKEKISIATLPNDPIAITVGTSKQVLATASVDGELVEDYTLTSSNTNYVVVNGKTIFGQALGSATLTITGAESNETRTITVNVVNSNNVKFDPDNGSTPTIVQVGVGLSIDEAGVTLPSDPTKTDYVFDRWYLYDEVNETLTTTPLDTTAVVTGDITYKAKWVSNTNYVAVYGAGGTTYHTTLQSAFNAVPTTGVATEVKLLQNIVNPTGQTKLSGGRSVILNGGNYSMTAGNATTNRMIFIETNSSLRIISGTYSCGKSTLATLENSSGCHLYIDGGLIENTNDRGAIFNNGIVEITGGTLTSTAPERGVVQNAGASASITMSGGTVTQLVSSSMGALHNGKSGSSITITGGTVTSAGNAIQNINGTHLTVGTQNDAYDATSPVIQGELSGITSTVTYSIYDGIIKGKSDNRAVNDFAKITGIETDAERVTDTEGDYYTLYYELPNNKYQITFEANQGSVTPTLKEFSLNSPITASDLPTPTRTDYIFDGWYTDSNLETPFATFTPTTVDTVTYYAKWTYYLSSYTPVNHNILSDAMQDYFTDVSSWVAADATDPSNPAPPAVAPQTKTDYDNGHHLFKDSISEVFTTNNCSSCGADNNCDSPRTGTYCDQAVGYNTGISEDVNVYSYENGVKGSLITYTTSTGGIIYNMIPGKTYLWESATDNAKYGVVTATGDRRTLKTSVRNLRDLGGLSATNSDASGTIDYGRLYRGAQITSQQGVTDLTKLGVTREVDLRGNGEGSQSYKLTNYDTGTSSSYSDIIITNYIINPTATTYITSAHINEYRAVKAAMREIMEKVVFNHDSIFFHCTIGTDRTGTMAYFLEGLLGVSEEDRLRDYDMTYFFGLTNRTRFHDTSGWSNTAPRFYSMYRSYPTNADIYNYYTYESHVVDPNNPNDLTDDELLRRFRLELIH